MNDLESANSESKKSYLGLHEQVLLCRNGKYLGEGGVAEAPVWRVSRLRADRQWRTEFGGVTWPPEVHTQGNASKVACVGGARAPGCLLFAGSLHLRSSRVTASSQGDEGLARDPQVC